MIGHHLRPNNNSMKTWQSLIWLVVRQGMGWVCLVLGLLIFPLPIPLGLPLIVLSIVLIGRRNPIIRWLRVHFKLLLRRWAALQTPIIGPVGRMALHIQKEFSRKVRAYTMQQSRKRLLRDTH